MNQLLRIASAVALLVVCARPSHAQPKKEADLPDTIVTKDEKKIRADIQREDPKKIFYKTAAGKDQEIAWTDVVRVDYKDFPGNLGVAESAIDRRDYGKGASAADEAIKDCEGGGGKMKELFLCRARVARAKALRGQGEFRGAAQVAEQALEQKDSKWAGAAHLERVCSLALAGDDACVKAGEDAESLASSFGEEWKCDILLVVGDFFLRGKKADKAKEKFAFAQNSQRRELQDRAKLGLGFVKLLEGNTKGAEETFEQVMKSTQDPDALCGACLGLGDGMIQKATAAGAKEKPGLLRQALSHYARGAVLAQPTGSSLGENHEQILRKAGETVELIVATIPSGNNAKDQASRKFFVDYARKIFEDLIRQYPGAKEIEKYRGKVADLRKQSLALSPADAAKPAEGAKPAGDGK